MVGLKTFVVALVIVLVAVLFHGLAEADHDKFQYKFPCRPQDACYVTSTIGAHHPPGDALDFDPQGSAGRGQIVAISEGVFVGYFNASNVCDESGGYGIYALVNDLFGRTIRFAHLSQTGALQVGNRVMQGDTIGIEGDTGHTHSYPGGVHTPCADHLHLGGVTTVSHFDGVATSAITAGPTLYTSTNSYVGHDKPNPNTADKPAIAIRDWYKTLGLLANPDNSWQTVGWTADWTGNQDDCPPSSFCRLYVHYAPHAVEGHWGSLQVFRKHPGTVPLSDDNAIMAGRWEVNDAYWVLNDFFEAWLGGYQAVGIPLDHRLDDSTGELCRTSGGGFQCCPAAICENYQRFSLGYIWEADVGGVQAPVPCFDVAGGNSSSTDPTDPGDWPDYYVDLFNDVSRTIDHYSPVGYPGPPYEYSPYAQYDVRGDGKIDLFNDIAGVIGHQGMTCAPQP